ncbi:MAG: DUF3552 domain-containing protein [Calditrichaeota bacterium]|nr:MAG: DUF3552 domain-containing protein [Calditrichota bacterium]
MELTINIFVLVGAMVALVGLGLVLSALLSRSGVRSAKTRAQEILAEAERNAERTKQKVILQAKEEWFKIRDEQESRLKARQRKVEQIERELLQTEKKLIRRENEINAQESRLKQRERALLEQRED